MTNQTLTGATISIQEMLNKCASENISVDNDETSSLHIAHILFCVLSLITAVTAVTVNGLLIWVISRTSSLQNPSNILLCYLATADFLIGAITQAGSVSAVIALETGYYDMYCTATRVSIAVGYFLTGVYFLTLTAVSLDRFLALHLHLRYRKLVTIPRVLAVEVGTSVVMVGFSAIHLAHACVTLLSPSLESLVRERCILSWHSNKFIKVIKQIAALQAQEQLAVHFHGQIVAEVTAQKMSSLTMFLAFFLFCVSFIPAIVHALTSFISSEVNGSRIIFFMFANFFVASNSSLSPFVFCYRIGEIRQAIVNLVRNKCLNFGLR